MKILITNDDSYTSESVAFLAQFFRSFGHDVTVIVPMKEQSGISMSTNVNRPFAYLKKDDHYYILDSSPVDCVRFGFYGLKRNFDLVVSGINHGLNISDDIYYSGTCGAVYEAGRIGTNALAISTNMASFNDSYQAFPSVWDYINKENLFALNAMWNVNIPMRGTGKIVYALFGDKHYDCAFDMTEDMLIQRRNKHPELEPACQSDVYQLEHNCNITISPLTLSRIDADLVQKLLSQK